MRVAGKIATVAMQEADILHTSIMGTEGLYGDSPAAVPFVMVGEDAHACHLYWTDREMPTNEMVVIELGEGSEAESLPSGANDPVRNTVFRTESPC